MMKNKVGIAAVCLATILLIILSGCRLAREDAEKTRRGKINRCLSYDRES